jgi:phosphatidate cytidylyltransferase
MLAASMSQPHAMPKTPAGAPTPADSAPVTKNKVSTKSDLAMRLGTAGVTAPLIIWSLYFGPPWFFPMLSVIACSFAAYELFAMVAPKHGALRLYGSLATLAVFAAIAVPFARPHLAGVMIACVVVGMLMALMKPEPLEDAALRTGWAIAGPIYIGGTFGAIAAIFDRPYGGSWVIVTLFFSFLSDTAGYFVGRKWGKHKLSPVVSPKKTIEGSIGGLAAGLLAGVLMSLTLLPVLPLTHAVPLALFATAAGQAGDLCESLIKRSTGVKDSGKVLPGHGGFLDRADAMMFVSAVVWAYVTLRGV